MKNYLIGLLLLVALPTLSFATPTPTLPTYANPAAVKAALDKAHDAVTLDANIQSTFSLATQVLGFQSQAANTILAGPASGANAAPTFRELTADDLPSLAGIYVSVDKFPAILTPSGFVQVNSAGTALEAVGSKGVEYGGFPIGSIPYADAEGKLQPHPTVDTNEVNNLDGSNENIQAALDALKTATNLNGLSVSVGGESDNTIVATIVGPAHNSLMEVWLSATDGGTYTTAFDGDSAAPWTLSDATAHITRTADVAYQILTGADGDAVVTLKHSVEATKYLCAACAGWVQCGEIAFSADVSPCVYSDVYRAEYTPGDIIKYGGAAGIANLCQKIKGSGSPITVCGVKFVVKKDAGVDADFHVELWDDGTDNAGNTKLSTQIGTDSGSVTVTTDGEDEVVIVYFSTPITTDGGDFFVHFINDSSASIYAAVQLFSSPMSYEDSPYDAWRQGTDQGDDINFELMTQ